jgi:hypothetical protein
MYSKKCKKMFFIIIFVVVCNNGFRHLPPLSSTLAADSWGGGGSGEVQVVVYTGSATGTGITPSVMVAAAGIAAEGICQYEREPTFSILIVSCTYIGTG